MKKFNAYQLKMIMAILMVLDHLKHVPNLISGDLQVIFHVLTRPVSVWFAYLVVEGFIYTRNKWKYNLRLGTWAIVMAIGNLLIGYVFQGKGITVDNNIIATFAISVLILNVIYHFKSSKIFIIVIKSIIVFVVLLFGLSIGSEGFVPVIPFIMVTYFLREKVKVRNIIYVAMALLMLSISYVPYDDPGITLRMLAFNSDFLFISILPLISLYNGERGSNTIFSKYFFYVFYPAHLWILAIVSYFVK